MTMLKFSFILVASLLSIRYSSAEECGDCLRLVEREIFNVYSTAATSSHSGQYSKMLKDFEESYTYEDYQRDHEIKWIDDTLKQMEKEEAAGGSHNKARANSLQKRKDQLYKMRSKGASSSESSGSGSASVSFYGLFGGGGSSSSSSSKTDSHDNSHTTHDKDEFSDTSFSKDQGSNFNQERTRDYDKSKQMSQKAFSNKKKDIMKNKKLLETATKSNKLTQDEQNEYKKIVSSDIMQSYNKCIDRCYQYQRSKIEHKTRYIQWSVQTTAQNSMVLKLSSLTDSASQYISNVIIPSGVSCECNGGTKTVGGTEKFWNSCKAGDFYMQQGITYTVVCTRITNDVCNSELEQCSSDEKAEKVVYVPVTNQRVTDDTPYMSFPTVPDENVLEIVQKKVNRHHDYLRLDSNDQGRFEDYKKVEDDEFKILKQEINTLKEEINKLKEESNTLKPKPEPIPNSNANKGNCKHIGPNLLRDTKQFKEMATIEPGKRHSEDIYINDAGLTRGGSFSKFFQPNRGYLKGAKGSVTATVVKLAIASRKKNDRLETDHNLYLGELDQKLLYNVYGGQNVNALILDVKITDIPDQTGGKPTWWIDHGCPLGTGWGIRSEAFEIETHAFIAILEHSGKMKVSLFNQQDGIVLKNEDLKNANNKFRHYYRSATGRSGCKQSGFQVTGTENSHIKLAIVLPYVGLASSGGAPIWAGFIGKEGLTSYLDDDV